MQRALGAAQPPSTITRTYGRGSLLGFLAPLFAWLMASIGMHGWEDRARRDMEADAIEMRRRGYRVAVADEYRVPALGVTWFKVTYELVGPEASPGSRPARWLP